jgi:hypothetical protein
MENSQKADVNCFFATLLMQHSCCTEVAIEAEAHHNIVFQSSY